MNDSIYESPKAELETEQEADHEFYVVAPRKFLVMYFGTFSLYGVYWFYKNWALIRARSGESLWPVPRAIFAIFFTHSLFDRVDKQLQSVRAEFSWSPSTVATVYVLFTIMSTIADRLAEKEIGSPYTDFISFLVIPVTGWALYKAQIAVNHACEDSNGESNSNFTLANFAWLTMGLALWVLILFGLSVIIFGDEFLY